MSHFQQSTELPKVVTRNDVQEARLRSERSKAAYGDAEAKLSEVVQRQQELTKALRTNGWIEKTRRLGDQTMTRIGLFINLLLLPSALSLIVTSTLGFPVIAQVIVALAVSARMGFLGLKLFKPVDEALRADTERALSELTFLGGERSRRAALVERAKAAFWDHESAFQNILLKFQSRINYLRSVEWRNLQAVPFEEFLAEVFREWGYQVETTKVTGDQGVDLIVSRNGARTAVQAKGYISSTVGNSAVQEAFTGMKIYKCQRCAVITNSTFTSSARQAATAVGCVLIDGEMLPSLIDGEMQI
jgi:hypothetical protein